MSQLPQTLEGGANSYKVGSLKRRIPAVILATLDNSSVSDLGTINAQLVLKNLNGVLKIQIAASFASVDDGSAITPDEVPAGAATMQLTPAVLTPNQGRIYLRPVFQDPTASPNANNPLPQDLPFGWEFSTEADEVYINFVIDSSLLEGTNLGGAIICAVTIEYNGQWWQTEAVRYAISQVQLTGTDPPRIGTEAG
jgi:hypothetical protein